jgi:uncharacterized protein YjdB
MKKLLAMALALLTCITMGIATVGCNMQPEQATGYTVQISEAKISIEEFSTYQLSATVRYNGSIVTDKKVSWSSNDASIASVSNDGLVSGIKEGTTAIICEVEGKTAVCNVAVGKYEIKLEISKTYLEIPFEEDYSFKLSVTATKSGEEVSVTPEWKSSNTNVATVDANGKVTIKGEGDCYITAKVIDSNGFYVSARCIILVGSEKTEADRNDVTAPDIDWGNN